MKLTERPCRTMYLGGNQTVKRKLFSLRLKISQALKMKQFLFESSLKKTQHGLKITNLHLSGLKMFMAVTCARDQKGHILPEKG